MVSSRQVWSKTCLRKFLFDFIKKKYMRLTHFTDLKMRNTRVVTYKGSHYKTELCSSWDPPIVQSDPKVLFLALTNSTSDWLGSRWGYASDSWITMAN